MKYTILAIIAISILIAGCGEDCGTNIFRNAKNQYKIDGKLSLKADKIINSKAIETLLRYPKRF